MRWGGLTRICVCGGSVLVPSWSVWQGWCWPARWDQPFPTRNSTQCGAGRVASLNGRTRYQDKYGVLRRTEWTRRGEVPSLRIVMDRISQDRGKTWDSCVSVPHSKSTAQQFIPRSVSYIVDQLRFNQQPFTLHRAIWCSGEKMRARFSIRAYRPSFWDRESTELKVFDCSSESCLHGWLQPHGFLNGSPCVLHILGVLPSDGCISPFIFRNRQLLCHRKM